MKKYSTLVIATLLASASTFALAGHHNDYSDRGYQHPHKGHHCEMKHHRSHYGSHHAMSAQKRQALMQLKIENKIEKMDRKLNLSPQQKDAIRGILKARYQQIHKIKEQSRADIQQQLNEQQRSKREKHQTGEPHHPHH